MLVAERRFAEPLARTAFALEQLADLVAEASAQMEQAHQGGRRFDARFFRTDGLMHPLRIETSLPTRDQAVVMALFRARDDNLNDHLEPGTRTSSVWGTSGYVRLDLGGV